MKGVETNGSHCPSAKIKNVQGKTLKRSAIKSVTGNEGGTKKNLFTQKNVRHKINCVECGKVRLVFAFPFAGADWSKLKAELDCMKEDHVMSMCVETHYLDVILVMILNTLLPWMYLVYVLGLNVVLKLNHTTIHLDNQLYAATVEWTMDCLLWSCSQKLLIVIQKPRGKRQAILHHMSSARFFSNMLGKKRSNHSKCKS